MARVRLWLSYFIRRKVKEKLLFKNCISIIQTPKGWLPLRFTEKQLQIYQEQYGDSCYVMRARSGAGVCMEFWTEQNNLSFEFEAEVTRGNMSFDIYENDQFQRSISVKNQKQGVVTYDKRGTGVSKITIYLPYTCPLMIRNIQFGDWIPVNTEKKKKILMLGDSITQGVQAMRPSYAYAALVARNLEAELLNQGVGGTVFNHNVIEEHLPFSPDVVIVAYGTNDFVYYQNLDEFQEQADLFLKKLHRIYNDKNVFVITPTWRILGTEQEEQRFVEFCDEIKKIAETYGFYSMDGLEIIPHEKDYLFDHVHPNEKGFALYAKYVCDVIKKNVIINACCKEEKE